MKIHLGCGPNHLQGWVNHDAEVDIRRKLPWRDGEADFVFAEHLIEHVTFPEGIRFLDECRRILRHGGVLRLSFPNAEKLCELDLDEIIKYRGLVSATASRCAEKSYLPLRDLSDCLRLLFCGWGHQSAWTENLSRIALRVAGFRDVTRCSYGRSEHPELAGIDRHHVSSPSAAMVTSIVEAW